MIDAKTRRALLDAAMAVQKQAYAPYSNYPVGAAILAENGVIYAGCNVENASYGLTICAERNAVFQMVADGCQRMLAVVVVTENGGSPCGACRQVLVEFSADIPVVLADTKGGLRTTSLYTLIPDHFGPEHLSEEEL